MTVLDLGGVRTRIVEAEGDSDRVRFLFLHGFTDSADTWRRVQRRLSAAGIGSVAVDQPSHGAADAVDTEAPVVDQFVSFAAAAAEHARRDGPLVVCGNSLGGAHALLLAERHPDLVDGVVVISPAAFDHPRWFQLLGEERIRARLRAGDEIRPNAVRGAVIGGAFRTVTLGRPWRAPRPFITGWRRSLRDPDRRASIRALARRLPDEYLFVDDLFDLAAIRSPVLALWGNRDRLALISSRRALEAGVADCEFVELRGVGHLPQVEVPGLTTKFLRRFTDRLEQTTSSGTAVGR